MSSIHCQQPVFDSHPPELYGSLGAEASSQRNGGGGYLHASESLAVESTSPAESQNTGSGYMALRNQEREPSNEYDYIPGDPTLEPPLLGIAPEMRGGEGGGTLEKRRNGGGGGAPADSGAASTTSGGRKVMKNSMYENHDVKPLLHPTLAGPKAKETVEGVGVRAGERCTCGTKSLVQAFFLAMTMLLAVASLGLSGLMWFGVNDNEESPTDAATLPAYTPEMTECNCPASIDLLRAELQEIQSALKELDSSVLQTQSQLSSEANILPSTLESLHDLSSDVINTTNLCHSNPSIDVLVNASRMYDTCETVVKDTCSLPNTAEINNCTTDYVLTNTSDSYELNSMCRYRQQGGGVEFTALMATLEMREEDGAVRCSCLRLGDSPFVDMECQLVVTSCPLQWDLGVVVV